MSILNNQTEIQKESIYPALVWIFSSFSLITFGILSLTNNKIPGVEQLVDTLAQVKGIYIYSAAFLTIFIEGLYVVGSFFPGSTIIVLLTLLSHTGGISSFLFTILAVFLGWCSAGVVNIIAAKLYGKKILDKEHNPEYDVKDRLLTTWFPAFRANYEVSQIAEGGKASTVLFSSIRVKFYACIIMLCGMALLPLFVNVNEISNEEGVLSAFIIAAISMTVGIYKLKKRL